MDRMLLAWFFVSGASALIYEVVWLRWLVHLFGATTLAVSTILAAFMAGLAVGSWAAGRWASRVARPLVAYGLLELAIGAYALALPWLLPGIVPILGALGATEGSSYAALSLGRFALAAALLVVPTACMGATLPILAQFAAPWLESLGGRVGRLYAVNTAGAVVGTAAAGFLLLQTVGVARTNAIAVALNVAVGLTAALAGWRLRVTAVPVAARGAAEAGPPETALPTSPDGAARRLALGALLTAALSGALAMVYEVAWTRALALVLGSSVYAFTVMLTTFLIGLAGGSWLLARRVDRLAEPGVALGLTQLGIAAAAFAGLAALEELPWVFLRLFDWSRGRHPVLLALEFVIAGATILGPALLSGAVFPLCVRLTATAGGWVGRTVGDLYAVNTVGAIVGSFVAGFVLIPGVGIRGSLLLAILLNLGCAFVLLTVLPTRRPTLVRPIAAGLPILALIVPLAAPEWKALTMASGVAVYAPGLHRLSRQEFHERRRAARLLWYEEGLTTTVSVEERDGLVSLRVNGKTDASTGGDMPNQVLLGHLPILLHPEPQDALVIGLGSGVTVGSALRHPLRAVAVVELERAVVTASRFFDHVSFRPLEDARTHLVVNDARNFLLLTRDRSDVIISEPSNPWMTGAASLFTRDFFALAKTRLRPGGVFGQWVQLYGLTPETFRIVIATFASVFPHTVVFHTSFGDTVLVGSEAPFRVDFAALGRRIAAPEVAADLARVGIRDAPDLLARLVLDVEDVPRLVRGTPLNTDDNARIEFTAPRTLYVDAAQENVQRLADAFLGGGTLLETLRRGAPPELPARLGDRLLARERPQQADAVARAALRGAPPPTVRVELLRVAAAAAAARGEVAEAERRWQAALQLDPGHPGVLLDLAAHLDAHGALGEAHGLVQRAAVRGGAEAVRREAALLLKLGRAREAEARLGRLPPDLAGVALARGEARLALGDAAGAEPLLRAALRAREAAPTHRALAEALARLGRTADAQEERRRATQLDERAAARLRRLARVRADLGHLRWAAHDLRQAQELLPGRLELRRERARLLERLGERQVAIEAWEDVFRAFPAYALALVEVATLWDAEGDPARAREALQRYVAAEADPRLRQKAEAMLRSLPPAR